jgi:hypothetical protein
MKEFVKRNMTRNIKTYFNFTQIDSSVNQRKDDGVFQKNKNKIKNTKGGNQKSTTNNGPQNTCQKDKNWTTGISLIPMRN